MNKELLKQLKMSPAGKELYNFLDVELQKLNDVTTIETLDDALGRKHAVKLIKKLFSLMEENEVTNKTPNQYR